ncbi:MAG: DUF924 family protein [Halieaceae bacterium]|nr:DUF924 family protein [Halieaceae bacterium]
MNDLDRITALHQFWFGPLDADGMPGSDRNKLWYGGQPETDAEIRTAFGADVEAALAGQRDHWLDEEGGLVALVLLLDQFTRNVYRGEPRAFSGDDKALALASSAIADGADRSLPTIHRVFLYTPFEHAEELGMQQQGCALFEGLLAECPSGAHTQVANFHRYMLAHRDVIERFGRFPHRNAILGRASSPEELAHLEKHGGF